MFYIQRGEDEDPGARVQDDDDDEVLDFVFDGAVRYASTYASEGRKQITALRELVEGALGGHGDAAALQNAIDGLEGRITKALAHFEKTAQQKPDFAEFCVRNLEAYGRARDGLLYMRQWLRDPRKEYLTEGMTALERAVADVDALVEEEQGTR